MKVCSECGSDDVFFVSYVSVNNTDDVRRWKSVDCYECGGQGVDIVDA